ncbi:AtpZ/AtpI family protein [Hyphococcus sp.]|uniref:AtpZ/AtpI family protein n=1 Tax=Hyphococcus sp. TaxID=2038636 RepID=UPI0035C77304
MSNDSGADKADENQPGSLEEFSERLDRMRGAPEEPEPHKGASAMGRAMRLSTELLAGLFVGCLIGLGLDRWLGTSPLFLLVGIGVGFAAGVLNVARAMKE